MSGICSAHFCGVSAMYKSLCQALFGVLDCVIEKLMVFEEEGRL